MMRIDGKRIGVGILGICATIVVLLLGGWVWVLASENPLDNPIAGWLPWPVACSTRGCVTMWSWQRHELAAAIFAQATEEERLSPAATLTTLVRQHLAHYAQLKSPITDADAARYREDILNATDEAWIQSATGMTLVDYDEYVVKPFLEQESVRQQRRAEQVDDLYKQLAQERWVIVLPFSLSWDREQGRVQP